MLNDYGTAGPKSLRGWPTARSALYHVILFLGGSLEGFRRATGGLPGCDASHLPVVCARACSGRMRRSEPVCNHIVSAIPTPPSGILSNALGTSAGAGSHSLRHSAQGSPDTCSGIDML